MSKRRTNSPEFKARVAIEATSCRKSIQEIAADHAILPIHRAGSKTQHGLGWGLRLVIASRAVMSCITACIRPRIDRNPASRSKFRVAVRSVAITSAPLPR